jgi:hypothetical protein
LRFEIALCEYVLLFWCVDMFNLTGFGGKNLVATLTALAFGIMRTQMIVFWNATHKSFPQDDGGSRWHPKNPSILNPLV